jgi:hypothetical protein
MARKTLPQDLRAIQRQVETLPLADLQSLHNWLAQQIQRQLDAADSTSPPNRHILNETHLGEVCYQQELVRCGKVSCKCQQGELHGPYWYKYQRVNGKLTSQYLGKHFTPPRPKKSQHPL